MSIDPSLTMRTLVVHRVLPERILISRESARLLEGALRGLITAAPGVDATGAPTPITVDFTGVEGISPSFLDELLTVFESVAEAPSDGQVRSLVIANPPTRLSAKFEALARGHARAIRVLPDGSWLLEGGGVPRA